MNNEADRIDHLPPLPPPPEPLIIQALTYLLQPQTFPTLVCCNMGRHRSGTVVGCYRKLQRWALSSILEEYRRYAGIKVRVLNEQVSASREKHKGDTLTGTVHRAVRYGSGGDHCSAANAGSTTGLMPRTSLSLRPAGGITDLHRLAPREHTFFVWHCITCRLSAT
jgi:hypothetical protein